MYKQRLGKLSEDMAASFLKKRGLRIIERNFFCRFGEIDIIAKDSDELVFVEVRSGSDSNFADPLDSIRGSKIKRLKKTALIWLNMQPGHICNIRFDIIIVVFKNQIKEGAADIRYLKGVFMD